MEAKSKKRLKIIIGLIVAILAIGIIGYNAVVAIITKNVEHGSENLVVRAPKDVNDPNTLNVAVYPYVPDIAFMEKTAAEEFAEIAPNVTLNFVDWDCYLNQQPDDIDVFMYDSIYEDVLLSAGYLAELDPGEYPNLDGIMPFSVEQTQLTENGSKHTYGLPFMLCSYFLIYRDGDTEIEKVENIYELYDVIGNVDDNPTSLKSKGLVTNYTDNYPYYYIEAIFDDKDPSARDIENARRGYSEQALNSLETIYSMAGGRHAMESATSVWLQGEFGKGERFAQGNGRALIGYSEELTNMGNSVKDMNIKLISLGDGENQTIFYTDLISYNNHIKDPAKIANCKKFIDFFIGEKYLYTIIKGNGAPTYLLPIRESLFDKLAVDFPMYNEIHAAIADATKVVPHYGDWYAEYTERIMEELPGIIEERNEHPHQKKAA